MLRRSLVVVVAAVTVVLLSASAVGAAVRPFNPAQTVAGGCNGYYGDSVMSSAGALVGYATCENGGIRFFSRNADGTVNPSRDTGVFGDVLGVAADTTGSYVLFATDVDIRVGRRTNAGVFSYRVVDAGLPPYSVASGDVIARNGQWFGVWSKNIGTGGEFGQTELFAAGSAFNVRRVTTTAGDIEDTEPTLAYSGSVPVLIWTRYPTSSSAIDSDLYVTKFTSGTWEPARVFASAGDYNFFADMHIAGGRTFVAWYRDGYIWVASNATGSFTSRRFNTGGYEPKVAASTTSGAVDHVFVTWAAFNPTAPSRVFFAESATAGSVHLTWDGALLGPTGAAPLAVGGAATKGTVTYTDYNLGAVAIRSQA